MVLKCLKKETRVYLCSSQNENILYTSEGLHKARNDYDFENRISSV